MSDYKSLNEEQRKVWDAAKASDHWMRQYELKDQELRKAKDEIAELKADAAANANARDYRMGQHELKDEELLKAKDEIAELKRRLERQWRALHSEVETRARLQEDNERLWEDNERLSALLRSTEHNHAFERDHNDTQA